MTIEIACSLKDDYLYVKYAGAFDPSSAKEVCRQWVGQARRHGVTRVLCDITRVTGMNGDSLSVATIFEMNAFVARHMPRTFRLAVLETLLQPSLGRFAEDVMVNRGACVKVTSSLDDAIEWLHKAS